MTAPRRIQRQRTKGWKMPANTIYVGRPTRFGNPFLTHADERDGHGEKTGRRIEIRSAEEAVSLYRKWLGKAMRSAEFDRKADINSYMLYFDRKIICEEIATLRGKNLACWCPLDQPCHADVLLELANA